MIRFAFFALILLVGCSPKNPDPNPADPTPAFALNRALVSQTSSTSATANYTDQAVKGEAYLSSSLLSIGLDAKIDYIGFEIDRSALNSQWLGDYALRSKTRPGAPVTVLYSYTNMTTTATSIYRLSTLASDLMGTLSITNYDPARHLISGTYRVEALNQLDPRLAPDTDERSQLIVAGSFTDLKFTIQQY